MGRVRCVPACSLFLSCLAIITTHAELLRGSRTLMRGAERAAAGAGSPSFPSGDGPAHGRPSRALHARRTPSDGHRRQRRPPPSDRTADRRLTSNLDRYGNGRDLFNARSGLRPGETDGEYAAAVAADVRVRRESDYGEYAGTDEAAVVGLLLEMNARQQAAVAAAYSDVTVPNAPVVPPQDTTDVALVVPAQQDAAAAPYWGTTQTQQSTTDHAAGNAAELQQEITYPATTNAETVSYQDTTQAAQYQDATQAAQAAQAAEPVLSYQDTTQAAQYQDRLSYQDTTQVAQYQDTAQVAQAAQAAEPVLSYQDTTQAAQYQDALSYQNTMQTAQAAEPALLLRTPPVAPQCGVRAEDVYHYLDAGYCYDLTGNWWDRKIEFLRGGATGALCAEVWTERAAGVKYCGDGWGQVANLETYPGLVRGGDLGKVKRDGITHICCTEDT